MSISINTKQAYSEVDEFLNLLTDEQKNEVPFKLRKMFKEEKDQNYKKNINPKIPIKEQNLKRETLGIIALLNLKYWCKDEDEKQKLKDIYKKNEEEYQKKLEKKYSTDIFNKKEQSNIQKINNVYDTPNKNNYNILNTHENTQIIEYKEKWYKKILNKILKLFNKKI